MATQPIPPTGDLIAELSSIITRRALKSVGVQMLIDEAAMFHFSGFNSLISDKLEEPEDNCQESIMGALRAVARRG